MRNLKIRGVIMKFKQFKYDKMLINHGFKETKKDKDLKEITKKLVKK